MTPEFIEFIWAVIREVSICPNEDVDKVRIVLEREIIAQGLPLPRPLNNHHVGGVVQGDAVKKAIKSQESN